jgi:RNA recognition motif-containing protein
MEVYLQNLPPDLTDQGLKDQLSRYIKALSIQDWSCQKPRKRDFGFLTFLHPKDGERFLERHQHRPDSGIDVAGYAQFAVRLGILGNTVKCKRSNKAPDEFLLKSLVKSAEDRVQAKQ